MSNNASSEAAKAVVRRNTEEVQGKGDFDVFEELFADDFVDHTPQPNMTPDKPGARGLYRALRKAFPDFHAVIHWQTVDGEIVTPSPITGRTGERSWESRALAEGSTSRPWTPCAGTTARSPSIGVWPISSPVRRQNEWDR